MIDVHSNMFILTPTFNFSWAFKSKFSWKGSQSEIFSHQFWLFGTWNNCWKNKLKQNKADCISIEYLTLNFCTEASEKPHLTGTVLLKEHFIINIKVQMTCDNIWGTCCMAKGFMMAIKKEGEDTSDTFLVHFHSLPCAWGRLGLKREIRFPDAGKDERGAPVRMSRSWEGGVRPLMGAYYKFDIMAVMLGSVHWGYYRDLRAEKLVLYHKFVFVFSISWILKIASFTSGGSFTFHCALCCVWLCMW